MANVALPDIGKAFDAGQTGLNLVAVGYSLGLAASLLLAGVFALAIIVIPSSPATRPKDGAPVDLGVRIIEGGR